MDLHNNLIGREVGLEVRSQLYHQFVMGEISIDDVNTALKNAVLHRGLIGDLRVIVKPAGRRTSMIVKSNYESIFHE